MLAKESDGSTSTFNLPDEILQVLPSDPFEQLDVARKITSIALSTRLSSLEAESSSLQLKLAEKDQQIAHLHAQIEALDASLSQTSEKLVKADVEKESLLNDNASLANTVKKLQRDVSKGSILLPLDMYQTQISSENEGFNWRSLERGLCSRFKRMKNRGHRIVAKLTPPEDYATIPSRNSFEEDHDSDASRPGTPQLLASQTSTPRLTPTGSPPSLSASASPTRTLKPVSPRRHSVSFSTSRGMFDDRPSISTSDSGSQTGRTRVDGKEFFRQARNRLSYEQFGAFLANVKELNSHKQTREETLKKANEIFGPDNRDLYAIFEGLINRNLH
ncbi:putative prolyl 4-hydroxylase alpha subunit [Hibiscus syriacus]|uniref:Prolyl 4-hydroxylase alpha subunit n=1 Tax=Hibiscus syriacus TaxID=106335 RepID=A0A6A3CZH3_HIBSY|nr:putative prolyl 4-hydroxylase alpha subunit [Hibiscus syriacus]